MLQSEAAPTDRDARQSRGGPSGPNGGERDVLRSGAGAGRRAYGIQTTGLRVPEAPKEDTMSKHVLAQNQYGKAENRIVKVTRKGGDGSWHEIRDLNVSVALRGEFRDVHLTGDNANCLPTDTTKNTVYAFGKEHGIASPRPSASCSQSTSSPPSRRSARRRSGSRSTPGSGSRSRRARSSTPSSTRARRCAPRRSRTARRPACRSSRV